jgi:hypothetical protein
LTVLITGRVPSADRDRDNRALIDCVAWAVEVLV